MSRSFKIENFLTIQRTTKMDPKKYVEIPSNIY